MGLRGPCCIHAGGGFIGLVYSTESGRMCPFCRRALTLDDAALVALGKRLRSACGAGGTHRDGVIEVQGDHVDRLVALLQAEHWTLARAARDDHERVIEPSRSVKHAAQWVANLENHMPAELWHKPALRT